MSQIGTDKSVLRCTKCASRKERSYDYEDTHGIWCNRIKHTDYCGKDHLCNGILIVKRKRNCCITRCCTVDDWLCSKCRKCSEHCKCTPLLDKLEKKRATTPSGNKRRTRQRAQRAAS